MSKIDTIKAEDLNKFVSYTNGDFFCGNLAYGQREGQGVYMAFSGDKYMGTWKDDQPNGFGVMDQKTYLLEGDFKKGKAEGWGRMLVKEQEKDIQCYSLQCGHFHNDKLHGYGRILSKTEGLTEGCFLNGILEGPGIQTYTKGDFFVGQFANGKKNGIGMYFYYNGGYYIGQFKDDSKSGYGYLIDKHDCYYSGSWKNDAKNGAGFEVYRDGSKYKGFFNGNNKEGSGIMLYTQGIKYMGKWKNNKMHGFGRLDQKNIHPACGMYENGVLIKAQDVFLKEVIAEVDRAFVPDDFDHWISLSPDIKSSYLDSFICHEEDLEIADKYIYPEFLNQSHIQLLNGKMSSVNFLRLKNFLGGQGHALELYHTLRDRMFNWKYCDVKDVWKNCPSVGLRFNKHVIPWTGYVFPDLPTSEATKFCLDHMFMHDGVIEGHGLNCSLGDHYRLDGTIVDEGVITIYQTVRGTKNINVLNLVHGLFYLCGYNEFNKKVILMPELNHWGGYCTFKKQMKVDYPKKDLTMFFKIYDNQTIYGIGTDTVGNYTITGNVLQMENEEKIKYEINFVMNYVEGWSVLFEGVLCKDEIQGTWKTSSYSGQFVMKCNPYFNNEIVNKKLKFWNREDPKSRIMNKKEFENLGHPDINFFVNEEKKMEETVLSYLTRVRQMKDSEIDYDIDEACDANCHELKVIPTRAVSKRIQKVRLGLDHFEPIEIQVKDPAQNKKACYQVDLSEQFYSVGRKGPGYNFMFPNEFPSIFDNQPFVLDLPTDMMKGDLIDQSTGKMIDIHDFLKLCYPKLSDKLMKMLEEEKKRRSNRKIFLQNKKNGPEIYDEYLVQNQDDNSILESTLFDALAFMDELKILKLDIELNRFINQRFEDMINYDDFYQLMYDEESEGARLNKINNFREELQKQADKQAREDAHEKLKKKKTKTHRKKHQKRKVEKKKLNAHERTLKHLRDTLVNHDISHAPYIWAWLILNKVYTTHKELSETKVLQAKVPTKDFVKVLHVKGAYLANIEYTKKLKTRNLFTKTEIQNFYLKYDEDRDQKIRYTEFVRGIYGVYPDLDKDLAIALIQKLQKDCNPETIRELWEFLDQDDMDYFTRKELLNSMNQLKAIWQVQLEKKKIDPKDVHIPWPHLRLAKEIKRIDADGDGKIVFEEFEMLFFPPPKKHNKKQNMIDELQENAKLRKMLKNKHSAKELFERFDIDDNKFIDKAELLEMLKTLNIAKTAAEIFKVLEFADVDGSGTLDFDEFHLLIYGCKSPEQLERDRLIEEELAKKVAERNSPEFLKKQKQKDLLKYLSDIRYYEFAFDLLDKDRFGFIHETFLRNELEAIGVKLDMNVLKKYLQAVKKEANDKIKSQEEAIRKEWEKNPPRIPTLFKNFYNYDAKPQYYHNIEEHNNQFLMNTKATLYDIMYPDIRDKNFIYKINKKNDCVYSAKTKPQKDSFMWQGIQTCFEKQSLVQFENLILSSSTISGELKRGGNTFILHGHFDKLFSDVQRKEHITHAWQQINNDAKSFGTAKNSKEMAKAAHEMGNHQNPMFDEMYNMFGDKDIDSFVRLVGESKDCDYRIAIQGIINKNFEFEALLRKIDDNEDAVTPEQSQKLDLLGSECRVHVEFNEDGMPETLKGKGVNMSKNFCVMFYIGGELHFLTNAIKDIEIPHEMKDNLPLFFKKTHTQHVKEVETVDPQQNIKKVAFESDNLDKENAGPINVNIDGVNTFKTPEGILANPVKREASKSKAKKSKRSKSKSKSPTKKKAKKTRSKSPIKKGKKGKTTKKGTKTQGPADKTADKNKFISNDDPEARNLEIKPMEISQIGFETHNLSAMSSNVKRLNTKSSRQTTEPDNEMYEAYYLWKVGGNKETEVILIDQWVDKDTNEENFLFECADSTVQVSFKE